MPIGSEEDPEDVDEDSPSRVSQKNKNKNKNKILNIITNLLYYSYLSKF